MFQARKPYSAVTVSIDTLTSEAYDAEDLSGIPDLVEVISLQSSGPTEAARAIRKKLKYGNSHRQVRALVILDGLIQNAGARFQRAFADEPLLERLRVCGTSELSDPQVRRKCQELFGSWAQYGGRPGLERIAQLHRELPRRKVGVKQETSKVIRETENPFLDEEDQPASSSASPGTGQPSSSSSTTTTTNRGMPSSSSRHRNGSLFGKRKSGGKTKFNLEAEKEQIKSTMAEASVAATNLLNVVQTINRETERISENRLAAERFETCKTLRRRVLRYIHHVDHEQWLGPLLHANDELVHALMVFEQLDQSVDADSDSDDELAEQQHLYRMAAAKGKEDLAAGRVPSPPSSSLVAAFGPGRMLPPGGSLPGMGMPPPPPRPAKAVVGPVEEDDDPFADSNTVERW